MHIGTKRNFYPVHTRASIDFFVIRTCLILFVFIFGNFPNVKVCKTAEFSGDMVKIDDNFDGQRDGEKEVGFRF